VAELVEERLHLTNHATKGTINPMMPPTVVGRQSGLAVSIFAARDAQILYEAPSGPLLKPPANRSSSPQGLTSRKVMREDVSPTRGDPLQDIDAQLLYTAPRQVSRITICDSK
jgi:hypothetical protein